MTRTIRERLTKIETELVYVKKLIYLLAFLIVGEAGLTKLI